ncbi:MAG TPA: IclR family transcriptional regulator C-terminal domain-containing protein, partial [Stellaceae bacterium]|nr:IclR family transcriptional regulator C-terminal domain-containing protein [Stellaceae bacterium]
WTGVTIIDVLGGIQDVRYTLKIGAVFQFHCSAHGKLALAFGDRELLERTIARGLAARTPKTIVSPDALRREVQHVRKHGWAMAPEEADLGMNALTAPIFSSQGRFEGSIGVFGSLEQIGASPPTSLVRAVVQAARRISQRLGSQ